MVKQLIIAGLLALCITPARAQPTEADIVTYRAKLAEYVARGAEPDAIVKGLNGWFGWPFIARRDYVTGAVDYLVKAPVNGAEIRYLRTIGSVSDTAPHILVEAE